MTAEADGEPGLEEGAKTASKDKLKEYKAQKAKDLREGQEWNEIFKDAANFRNEEKWNRFWVEMKNRLIRRYGTIQIAFKSLDSSGDNSMSFLEFCEMLRQLCFPFDQRICRALFEKASGGDRAMSCHELKTLLLGGTIRKLCLVFQGFNTKQERVQGHAHQFLKTLSLSDEARCELSVDRFQRKLTVAFCRSFWNLLLVGCKASKADALSVQVDRATFASVVKKMIGTALQAYEASYMVRIFDRADEQKRGSVGLTSLIGALLLMSTERDRCSKLALFFEMYDCDYDGCLLYGQVLAMCQHICSLRPIAEETARAARDHTFQSELSTQEGLRIYECALWHLERSGKVKGEIVSLRELWNALDAQPEVLDALLPGMVRMHWLVDTSAGRGEEDELEAALAAGPEPKPRGEALSPEPRDRKKSSGGTAVPAGRGSARSGAPPGPGLRRQAGSESLSRVSAAIKWVARETEEKEGVRFKRDVTQQFCSSLRNSGSQRLMELTAGFASPWSLFEEGDLESTGPLSPQSHGASAPSLGLLASPQSTSSGGMRSPLATSPSAGSIDHLPTIDLQRWGGEAAHRFRLFSAVTTGSPPGRERLSPAKGSGISYGCMLCQRPHTMTPQVGGAG